MGKGEGVGGRECLGAGQRKRETRAREVRCGAVRRTFVHHSVHACLRENGHLAGRQDRLAINSAVLGAHVRPQLAGHGDHDVGGVRMVVRGQHGARAKVQLGNGLVAAHEERPGGDVGVEDRAWFEGLRGLCGEVEHVVGVGERIPEVEVSNCHLQFGAEVRVDGFLDGQDGGCG